MASSVENKVVSLKFDNSDFMKKLGPTLSAIEELKKSLDFKETEKSLSSLSSAGKNLDLGGIGDTVEETSGKFSILAGAASVALGNIAAAAIQAGAAFAKSFVFAPINDGFKEFETNANSIQTILANTADRGITLDDVSKSLGVLNTYADKTVFNFGEMTRGIGLFTANNVDLQTSVDAVKGISNLIAMTGGDTTQAKGAFVQLSQAISRGSLQAQDWMSVMTAGFGGPLQKLLFESAKALHTLPNVPLNQTFDEWTKHGGDFKEAMADGVFTADTLKISLQAMSGDLDEATLMTKGFSQQQAQYMLKTANLGLGAATEVKTFTQLIGTLKEAVGTGWAESFGIVIGDFNEAKVLLTGLSNAFGGVINIISGNRNADLSFWKVMGGREGLVQSLRNVLWSLFLIVVTFKNAFREVFPYKVGQNLVKITEAVQKFTAAIAPSGETLEKFKRIFIGVFSVFSILKTAFGVIFNIIGNVLNIFGKFSGPGTGGFLTFLAAAADKVAEFALWLKDAGDGINAFIDEHLGGIAAKLDEIDFAGFFDDFKRGIDVVWEFINGMIDFGGVFNTAHEAVQKFWDLLNSKVDFSGLFQEALTGFDQIKTKVVDFFKGLGGDSPGDFIAGFTAGIKSFASKAFDAIKEFALKILETIKGVLGIHSPSEEMFNIGKNLMLGLIEGIKEVVPKMIEGIKNIGKAIINGFRSVDYSAVGDTLNKFLFGGFLVSLIGLIRNISKTYKSVKGATDSITGVLNSFKNGLKDFGDNQSKFEKAANAIKTIAKALVILAIAVFIFSKVDPERMVPALAAMAGSLILLSIAMGVVAKVVGDDKSARQWIAIGVALVAISVAMAILGEAVKIFSGIDVDGLQRGIGAVVLLLIAMGIFIRLLPNNNKAYDDKAFMESSQSFVEIGIAMILFAHALKTMAKIVKTFAEMDAEQLKQGMAALVIVMFLLIASLRLMPEHMDEKAKGMLFVAAAMWIIAKAIESMGNLPFDVIKQGMIAFGLIMAALTLALSFIPEGVVESGLAILAIAAAMVILFLAVKMFGEMDFNTLIQGLIAIGLLLLAMVIAGNAMRGTTEAAAAILLIAFALIPLAYVIKILADIGFGSVILAILGLALALVVLGAVAYAGIATGATLALAALAIVLILFAEAALLFGVGALAMGLGIAILVTAFSRFLDVGERAIVFFRDDLPTIMLAVGKSLAFLVRGFLEQIPGVLTAFTFAVLAVIRVARTLFPAFVELFLDLILSVLTLIDEHLPDIQARGYSILFNILEGIRVNTGRIVDAVGVIILTFLAALWEWMPLIGFAGIVLIVRFLQGIESGMGMLTDQVVRVITSFFRGMADAFDAHHDELVTAITDFVVNFLTILGEVILKLTDSVAGLIEDFLNAMADIFDNHREKMKDAVTHFVGSFLGAMAATFVSVSNEVLHVLTDFLNAMADVIRENAPEIHDAMANLAGAIVDGLTGGLADRAGDLAKSMFGFITGNVVDPANEATGTKSPSKVFYELAGFIAQGLVNGLNDDTTVNKAATKFGLGMVESMNSSLSEAASLATGMDEFNPTITPVLDLSEVQKGATQMGGLLGSPTLDTSFTADQAASLAAAQKALEEVPANSQNGSPPQGPTFYQTINAPEPLDAETVYRHTKSQIAFAQEELSV